MHPRLDRGLPARTSAIVVPLVLLGLALGGAVSASALPREDESKAETPLAQAREESAIKDRPRSRFALPAGELRLSSAEVLAASRSKLEFSVSLSRAVERATLDLTLPARWVGRSAVSGLPNARVPGRGRSAGGTARRGERVVTFAFDDAKAGDAAKFEITDVGIPAGTYELPFKWRDATGPDSKGRARVVIYAPVREAEEAPAVRWTRLANPGLETNATDDAANESETFVTVVPGNKRRFIVGANGGGGYNAWITNDGGVTFVKAAMPALTDAPAEAGPETANLCCDPMSAADAAGNVWYGGLSQSNGAGNPSRIVVNRMAPGATSFQPQTVGLAARTAGTQDKPMMTIDNSAGSPTFGRLYVVWDEPSAGGINIVIAQCDTRSGGTLNAARCDDADNWSAPVSVTPSTGSYIYADVAVGPAGQVYVVWWNYSSANAIQGDVCTPPGQSCATAAGWGTPGTIATLDATNALPIPFACPIVAQPGGRASTSPQVDVDRSGGAHSGRVYVTWSDLRTGSGTTRCAGSTTPATTHLSFDNFVASAPGGLPGAAAPSPSVATRLLTDGEGGGAANSDDWFSWLAVDQTTGQAWADFYSTRDDATRRSTNFYARTVTPAAAGGTHTLGTLTKVSGAASDYSTAACCNFGNDYGDYTGIDATQGIAIPVWSDKRSADGEAFIFGEILPGLSADSRTLDDSAAAGGDGDTALEPGESFRLDQRLRNDGTAAASGVQSTLTESLPGLTLNQTTSAYPDIAPGGGTQGNATPFAGTLSAGAQCGTPVSMTLEVVSGGLPFSVPVSIPVGAPGPVEPFTTSPGAPIPDNTPAGVSSDLVVAGVGPLTDLDVRLNVTHPFTGDLKVTVTSPQGTTVTLVQNRGGAGDNFSGTIFDDEAATAIAAGAAPFSGSFRPEQPLAAVDGQNANGTWTLKVVDTAGGDVGTLSSWRLDAQKAACSSPVAPPAVAGLTAVGGSGSVALSWDGALRATGYEVFRRNADGSYPATATGSPTGTAFTDSSRAAGTEYCYKVRAVNPPLAGPQSAATCATTTGTSGDPTPTPTPTPGGGGPGPGPPAGGDPLPVPLPSPSPGGPVTIDLSGAPRTVRISARGVLTYTFRATPNARGSLLIRSVKTFATGASGRKRKVVFVRKTFRAGADGRVKVTVKLSRSALRVLKRAKRIKASAIVKIETKTVKGTLTLRAPRPPR